MGIGAFFRKLFSRKSKTIAVTKVNDGLVRLQFAGQQFEIPLVDPLIEDWATLFADGKLELRLCVDSAIVQAVTGAPVVQKAVVDQRSAVITSGLGVVLRSTRSLAPCISNQKNGAAPTPAEMEDFDRQLQRFF